MILHYFSSAGWEEWGLYERPVIREAMPVLIDEDLCFADATELRRRQSAHFLAGSHSRRVILQP